MSLFGWKFGRDDGDKTRQVITTPVQGNVEHYQFGAVLGNKQYRVITKAVERFELQRMTQIDYLRGLLINYPTRFLTTMADINPFFKNVIGVTCQLAIGDGKFRIEVQDPKADSTSEEEAEELERWFNSQPHTTGNLTGIVEKFLCELMFFSDGLAAEGLFDKTDTYGKLGYKSLKPFSSSTVRIAIDKEYNELLVQWQTSGKWVELNPFHVFWQPNDARLDSPSGTFAMSTALIEMFGDLIMTTSLRDGVRSAGQPVRIFTFDKDTIVKRLIEIFKLLPTSQDFKTRMADERAAIEKEAATAKQTEYIVADKSTQVSHLDPADFQKVVPAVDMLQTRLASSLRTHRTVLGFGDSKTKGSLEYQMTAGYIEWKRGVVLQFIQRIAEQHLRFTGRERKVIIHAPKIHLNDSLVEENTAQLKFMNHLTSYAMGFITKEEFSKAIVGHDPHGTELEGAADALLKVSPGDNNNSKDTASSGGQGGRPNSK